MNDLWEFTPLELRPQWELKPKISVGPLGFGMTMDEVTEALDGGFISAGNIGPRRTYHANFQAGVCVYFDTSHALAAVAIDALDGPRLLLDGFQLTGRPPSTVYQWMLDRFQPLPDDPCKAQQLFAVGQDASPSSDHLGLIVRSQRYHDQLVTRPVASGPTWANCLVLQP